MINNDFSPEGRSLTGRLSKGHPPEHGSRGNNNRGNNNKESEKGDHDESKSRKWRIIFCMGSSFGADQLKAKQPGVNQNTGIWEMVCVDGCLSRWSILLSDLQSFTTAFLTIHAFIDADGWLARSITDQACEGAASRKHWPRTC